MTQKAALSNQKSLYLFCRLKRRKGSRPRRATAWLFCRNRFCSARDFIFHYTRQSAKIVHLTREAQIETIQIHYKIQNAGVASGILLV